MGYLKGQPHHPPPIPHGVWGSYAHMPACGHASNTRSPAEIAYHPCPYTGVHRVPSALITVARHTCAQAATPCREMNPAVHSREDR